MTPRTNGKLSFRQLALALLLLGSVAHAAEPTRTIRVDGHPVTVEVAATEDARMRGLMYRTDLGQDTGMLFLYSEIGYYAMWMKNTRIPLAVAFIDERGRILNIEEMAPETLEPHASRGPAKYSLEMNGGWFARRGVVPGAIVTGLTDLPKAE